MTAPAFRLLRNQRLKRVLSLNLKALRLIIDPVSALYIGAFLVLMIAFSREQLFAKIDLSRFSGLDPLIVACFLLFAGLGFNLSMVVSSPRYALTYSDFLLHFQPLNLDRYLRYVILRAQTVRALIACVVLGLAWLLQTYGFRVELLTPWGYLLLLGTYVYFDLLFGLLYWTLFQQRKSVRWLAAACSVFGSLGLLAASLLAGSYRPWFFGGIALLALPVLIGLWRRPLDRNVDWQRVVQVGEQKAWSGILIRLIVGFEQSAAPVNRPWMQDKFKRPPAKFLPYLLRPTLHRMWRRYLWTERRSTMFTLCFYILMIQGVAYRSGIPLTPAVGFLCGAMLAVYMMSSLLGDRLRTLSIAVLPWSRTDMMAAARDASLWLAIPVFVPQALFLVFFQQASVLYLILALLVQAVLSWKYYEFMLASRIRSALGRRDPDYVKAIGWTLYVGLTLALHYLLMKL